MQKFNRWYNRMYAKVFGYSWNVCPICAEEFGGHEAGLGVLIIDGTRFQTCRKSSCHSEAISRNLKGWYTHGQDFYD